VSNGKGKEGREIQRRQRCCKSAVAKYTEVTGKRLNGYCLRQRKTRGGNRKRKVGGRVQAKKELKQHGEDVAKTQKVVQCLNGKGNERGEGIYHRGKKVQEGGGNQERKRGGRVGEKRSQQRTAFISATGRKL